MLTFLPNVCLMRPLSFQTPLTSYLMSLHPVMANSSYLSTLQPQLEKNAKLWNYLNIRHTEYNYIVKYFLHFTNTQAKVMM